jgi:hypothetical protein
MEDKQKYFFVPISLIRGFVTETEQTITNIARYGALTFSRTDKVTDLSDDYFFEQFIYLLRNEPDNVPSDLTNQMRDFDTDRNGFNVDGEWESAEAVEELKDYLTDDAELKDEILDFCKYRSAYNFYYLSGSVADAYEWAKEIEKTIPAKTSTVMINNNSLMDFIWKKKTEKEKMRYAVYMGICSIVGEKKYSKTNRDLIFARALGYHSVAEVTDDKLWEKYNTRRRIITFLERLELENKIVFYTTKTMRGINVGYHGKITFTKMVENIQTKKIDDSAEKRRQEKRAIEQRIIEKLKNEKGH